MKVPDPAGSPRSKGSSPARGIVAAEWYLPLSLIALVALVFGRALGFEFTTYDDPTYVTSNPHLASGLSWEALRWALTSGYAANWHPTTWISHLLDVEFFGMDPAGHHFTSVLLHSLNAVLVLLFLRNATGHLWRSAIAAAFFAIHPLRVESVVWVAERKDVLSSLFGLATLFTYVQYVRLGGAVRYLAAILFFILAITSKPMLVTIPFLLWLLDHWPLGRVGHPTGPTRRRLLVEKVPFLVLSVVCAAITVAVQSEGGSMQAATIIPLGSRILNAIVAYAWYLWKTLLPARLSPLYLHPGVPGGEPWAHWQILAAIVALVGICALAWRFRRRGYPLVGWLWYLGTLVPVIGLVQVGGQAAADRYSYFPAIGLCLLGVWAATDVLQGMAARRPGRLRSIALATMIASLVLFGARTWSQVGIWSNGETLCRHALRVDPKNMLMHNNLGLILKGRGDLEGASHHFSEALRIHPLYRQATESLAEIAASRGDLEQAERLLRRACELHPSGSTGAGGDAGRVRILLNLADLLSASGRVEEARSLYREARESQPDLSISANQYGLALKAEGRMVEARQHLERAVRVDENNAEAAYNLGSLLFEIGELSESARQFERAVAIDKGMAEAHHNLGWVLFQSGQSAAAIPRFETAIDLRPSWSLPAQCLAWLLATDSDPLVRDPPRAIDLVRSILRHQEPTPLVLETLAAAQAAGGEFDAAIASLGSAIELSAATGDHENTARLRGQQSAYAGGHRPFEKP